MIPSCIYFYCTVFRINELDLVYNREVMNNSNIWVQALKRKQLTYNQREVLQYQESRFERENQELGCKHVNFEIFLETKVEWTC